MKEKMTSTKKSVGKWRYLAFDSIPDLSSLPFSLLSSTVILFQKLLFYDSLLDMSSLTGKC
jgi:hypothetical protein